MSRRRAPSPTWSATSTDKSSECRQFRRIFIASTAAVNWAPISPTLHSTSVWRTSDVLKMWRIQGDVSRHRGIPLWKSRNIFKISGISYFAHGVSLFYYGKKTENDVKVLHSQVALILHHLKDLINYWPPNSCSHIVRYFYLVVRVAYGQFYMFFILYSCVV